MYANCYAGFSKFQPVAKIERITEWKDAAGSGGKAATYRVKAVNEKGESAYSNAAANVPGAVADITATSDAPEQVTVTWEQMPPEDATSFNVGRCAGNAQTCALKDLNYRPVKCAEGTLDGHARKCTDKTSQGGATYTYRVRSANAAGSYKGWGGEAFGATPWGGGNRRAEVVVVKP